MTETVTDDPAIPFRMSHAIAIAEIKTELRVAKQILVFIGSAAVTFLAAILAVLLMKGGG
jgi:hypothetical protein